MKADPIGMRSVRMLCVCLIAFAAVACSTVKDFVGVGDTPSVSPRWAVQAAVNKIDPVIREVTSLIGANAVPKNVADDIAQFGPPLQKTVAAYFDNAEACVVLGGKLETDPAGGRACETAALWNLYNAVDRSVLDWANATGAKDAKAGQVVGAARIVLALVPRPDSRVYRDEPDMPLGQFQAMRATVKADFEAMLAAAAKRAGR